LAKPCDALSEGANEITRTPAKKHRLAVAPVGARPAGDNGLQRFQTYVARGTGSYSALSRPYKMEHRYGIGSSVVFLTVLIATLEFTRATPGSRVSDSLCTRSKSAMSE